MNKKHNFVLCCSKNCWILWVKCLKKLIYFYLNLDFYRFPVIFFFLSECFYYFLHFFFVKHQTKNRKPAYFRDTDQTGPETGALLSRFSGFQVFYSTSTTGKRYGPSLGPPLSRWPSREPAGDPKLTGSVPRPECRPTHRPQPTLGSLFSALFISWRDVLTGAADKETNRYDVF